jgi:reactive intermediate/imine deaminase
MIVPKITLLPVVALSALAAMPSGAAAAPAQYFAGDPGMPFSEAVRVGDMLILSGQIGVAPGTNALVPGGISAQARQAMDNIGAILKRRGLGFEHVVKCTVMLGDIRDWPAFNAVYTGYFKPDRMPARSAFAASGLAYGGAVEVECWARFPARKANR